MLTGKNIHKRYGTVEVLKGVDIDINKGEIVSIVGSSGAGKSTLLHILGTLDKADRGTVNLNGAFVSSLQGKKLADFRNKNIGFVFQFSEIDRLIEFIDVERRGCRRGQCRRGQRRTCNQCITVACRIDAPVVEGRYTTNGSYCRCSAQSSAGI